MTTDTFEYAIKKDIRNNPIVREIDRDRHREMWRSVAVGVFFVAVLLFSAWQHFELLRFGYREGEMQQKRAEQADIQRHLRLEIDTLRSPARIEQLAIEELKMVSPGPNDAVVIERVRPSAAPTRGVVARRAVD